MATKKTTTKKKTTKKELDAQKLLNRKLWGIGFITFSVITIFSLLGFDGFFLGFYKTAVMFFIGYGIYPLPIALLSLGVLCFRNFKGNVSLRTVCMFLWPILISTATHILIHGNTYLFNTNDINAIISKGIEGKSGGLLCGILALIFKSALSSVGALILLFVLILVSIFISYNVTPSQIYNALTQKFDDLAYEEDEDEIEYKLSQKEMKRAKKEKQREHNERIAEAKRVAYEEYKEHAEIPAEREEYIPQRRFNIDIPLDGEVSEEQVDETLEVIDETLGVLENMNEQSRPKVDAWIVDAYEKIKARDAEELRQRKLEQQNEIYQQQVQEPEIEFTTEEHYQDDNNQDYDQYYNDTNQENLEQTERLEVYDVNDNKVIVNPNELCYTGPINLDVEPTFADEEVDTQYYDVNDFENENYEQSTFDNSEYRPIEFDQAVSELEYREGFVEEYDEEKGYGKLDSFDMEFEYSRDVHDATTIYVGDQIIAKSLSNEIEEMMSQNEVEFSAHANEDNSNENPDYDDDGVRTYTPKFVKEYTTNITEELPKITNNEPVFEFSHEENQAENAVQEPLPFEPPTLQENPYGAFSNNSHSNQKADGSSLYDQDVDVTAPQNFTSQSGMTASNNPIPAGLAQNTNQWQQPAQKTEFNTPQNQGGQAVSMIRQAYRYPSMNLLTPKKQGGQIDPSVELAESSKSLIETLDSFGIQAEIINIVRGPSITRFEITINRGVKLKKITSLSDDIALSLGAANVRIAPIPDKGAIGIEVPNKNTEMVLAREVLESREFNENPSKLSYALGKDITGKVAIGDISKMPHMLIAGTTGSGKSVCVNTMIVSLLYKSNPDEVKFIMIDPKMVELAGYNGIPHLLIPVVTDPKKAAGALNWAVSEMMKRYNLFAESNVKNLVAYNELMVKKQAEGDNSVQKLPQIVIIIDELADLMMVAAKEIEESICRIAQMARAAGMHLVIATQRPSADVITGIMKSNIPSRVSFAVSSSMDSRIILDTPGAEKLIGKGDMLYNPIGTEPQRLQGCFISNEETEAVVDFVKQIGQPEYSEEILSHIENHANKDAPAAANTGGGNDDEDELIIDAIDIIVNTRQASTSFLQRKLKLGYSRASRIIDQIEERGIISCAEGSKGRQVLISKQEWTEMKIRQLGE